MLFNSLEIIQITFAKLIRNTRPSIKHVKLYRAYDENGVELGGYWTRIKPSGPIQTTIDLALDPNWGNRTNRWIEITVPPNQIFYEGVVSDIYKYK